MAGGSYGSSWVVACLNRADVEGLVALCSRDEAKALLGVKKT